MVYYTHLISSPLHPLPPSLPPLPVSLEMIAPVSELTTSAELSDPPTKVKIRDGRMNQDKIRRGREEWSRMDKRREEKRNEEK